MPILLSPTINKDFGWELHRHKQNVQNGCYMGLLGNITQSNSSSNSEKAFTSFCYIQKHGKKNLKTELLDF